MTCSTRKGYEGRRRRPSLAARGLDGALAEPVVARPRRTAGVRPKRQKTKGRIHRDVRWVRTAALFSGIVVARLGNPVHAIYNLAFVDT